VSAFEKDRKVRVPAWRAASWERNGTERHAPTHGRAILQRELADPAVAEAAP